DRLVFEHERRRRDEIDEAEKERQSARQQIEPGKSETLSPTPYRVDDDGEDRAGDGGPDAERRRQRPEYDERSELGEDEARRGGNLGLEALHRLRTPVRSARRRSP